MIIVIVTVPLGPKGDKGAQGVKGDKGQAASSGVKYVRWGKASCPNGAQIVYKGTKRGWLCPSFNSCMQQKQNQSNKET